MTNRLYNKVSPNVNNWEKEIITNSNGLYETARKVSVHLVQHYTRILWLRLHVGLANLLHVLSMTTTNFPIRLNVSTLITEPIHSDYPQVDLSLAIQQHLAPSAVWS